MEPIEAEVYNYPIKKQNSKTQFTTFTEQHKFKKNKDFYKAKIIFFQFYIPITLMYYYF